MKVLIVTSSLRSARRGAALNDLVSELSDIKSQEQLIQYIGSQTKHHKDNFPISENGDFYHQYKRYRASASRRKGLSNSEAAAAAAAWPLIKRGIEVEFYSASESLLSHDGCLDLSLIDAIRHSSAIILSSPVYFGDRSSPAEFFFEHLAEASLSSDLSRIFFASLSVGAKRNGGQETTNVFSLAQASSLGMPVLGNDSSTTAQYGGTLVAGDLGTLGADLYGLNTAIGTGNRIARCLQQSSCISLLNAATLRSAKSVVLTFGGDTSFFKTTLSAIYPNALLDFYDLSEYHQLPCLACDICPTHVGPDDEYRCIIKPSSIDSTAAIHDILLDSDVIFICIDETSSNFRSYQKFVERTRYLRRGDYALGDSSIVPVVKKSDRHMPLFHMRILTSFIRHHTVVFPCIDTSAQSQNLPCLKFASSLSLARLVLDDSFKYNPVGYVLSSRKDEQDLLSGIRLTTLETRQTRFKTRLID